MKKRKLGLSILIIIVGFLAFIATNFIRNRGKSDTELLEFSIADTSSINKIIITDPYGFRFEVKKNNANLWTDSKGNCIIQEPVHTMLETIKNVEFKGYIPENSRKTINNRMSAIHTKVEIFQNGDWTKTWYIGYSTQDHYGTYMLLETPNEKSDLPVIMKIKGFNGIIEPRFFADYRKWRCTEIFSYDRNEIFQVDVKNYENPALSFTVIQNAFNYTVKSNGIILPNLDTNLVIRYLNNYKKVHFELVNYELNPHQVDSVKKTKPFTVLTITEKSGATKRLKLFRIKSNKEPFIDNFGDTVNYEPNRFWCQLYTGELVKCQYHVFDPLILGQIYFALKP
ncbi:MAG: hypothetical protein HYU67_02265 [Flavobacteriia bacterium]|nr:hypothetical protein [Flavobacteriia bacterium]